MNWGIMMTDDNKDFPELDSLFASAQKTALWADESLIKRVLQDAEHVQNGFEKQPTQPSKSRKLRFIGLIGGWPALGTWAMATAAGVWIGISPPDVLSDGVYQVTQAFIGADDTAFQIDIAPGSLFDLGEEAL